MGPVAERRIVPLICIVLAVLTLAAFWQVVGHGFINYDDDDYVTANRHIRSMDVRWAFTSFHEANWHPLTWLSHMLDYRLFGLNAGGHHAVNLLLHLMSTILLFLVLRRMTMPRLWEASPDGDGASRSGEPSHNLNRRLETPPTWRCAFVAALFAIHPLHVESVAWVSERKDVLSTLFWMLTMLAYVRYAERPSIRRYLLVAGAFVLGLMAKPMLVTLPFVLLLLDWWPLGRVKRSTIRGIVLEKMPLIGLAAASSVITFVAQHRGLAVGSLDEYPVGVRIANALVASVAYLVKMVYPARLAVFYPHPGDSLPVWQVIGSAVLLAAITVLVVRARKTRPQLAVGWLWYAITLLPVIGLVQVGMQATADRYTYVPLVGVFIAVAWGVGERIGEWGNEGKGGSGSLVRPFALSPILCIAVLLPVTWKQIGHWRDSEALFTHALAVTERNAVAENNLGLALIEQGRIDEAIEYHRCAVETKPGWADAHYSLGAALFQGGRAYEAVPEFETALAIHRDHAPAHNNLGAALMQLGDLPGAVQHLQRAIELRPDYAQARNNLGTAYSYQGKWTEAMRQWTAAVRFDPYLAKAHYNLSIGLAHENRLREAIEECRKALALEPKSVETGNNLAWFLATTPGLPSSDKQEAVRLAEGLCRETKYSIPECLDTLTAAYASAGRREDAVRTARKALALAKSSNQPDLAAQIEAELRSYEKH